MKKTLRRHLRAARKQGAKAVLIAATEAIRLAENGPAVVKRLETALGVPIRILPGRTEARLAFLGSSRMLRGHGPQLLIDSGGGSTEVTLARGRKRKASASMAVGASLLCARLEHDPPGPLEWAQLTLLLAAAGALILHAVLSHYGLEEMQIGHHGLRDGMITAWQRSGGNWWRYRG